MTADRLLIGHNPNPYPLPASVKANRHTTMKLVLLIALSTFLSSLTGSKLKGTYKVEYDQRFKGFDDLSSIDFSDSTYKKTFKSGNKIHGRLLRSYTANKNEHWVRLMDHPSNAAASPNIGFRLCPGDVNLVPFRLFINFSAG